jgi:hypothetical protein
LGLDRAGPGSAGILPACRQPCGQAGSPGAPAGRAHWPGVPTQWVDGQRQGGSERSEREGSRVPTRSVWYPRSGWMTQGGPGHAPRGRCPIPSVSFALALATPAVRGEESPRCWSRTFLSQWLRLTQLPKAEQTAETPKAPRASTTTSRMQVEAWEVPTAFALDGAGVGRVPAERVDRLRAFVARGFNRWV